MTSENRTIRSSDSCNDLPGVGRVLPGRPVETGRAASGLIAALVAFALLWTVGSTARAQDGPLGKDPFGPILIFDDQPASLDDEIDAFDTLTGETTGSVVTVPSSDRGQLISPGDEARWAVPGPAMESDDWTDSDYDDRSWPGGPTGVGYGFEADSSGDLPIAYFEFETSEGAPVSDGQVAEGQVDDTAGHGLGPMHGVGSEAISGTIDGINYSSDVPAALAHSRHSIELDEFNPDPEYFALDNVLALQELTLGDFTLHAWFQTTDEDRNIIAGSYGDGNLSLNFELHNNNDVRVWIQGPVATTDLRVNVDTINDSRDGEWHVFTARRADLLVELYYDGQLVGQMEDVAGPYLQDTSASYFFGRDNRLGLTQYTGRLDDVAYWNDALTPEEIGDLHAGASPLDVRDDAIVLHYDFETQGGTPVSDRQSAVGPVDEKGSHPDGPFDAQGSGAGDAGGGAPALNYSADTPPLAGHSSHSLEIDESGRPEEFRLTPIPDPIRELTLGDFTMHVWFQTTDTGRSILCGSYGQGVPNMNFELHQGNDVRIWAQGPSATTDLRVNVDALGNSRDGQWHSAACVRRGAVVELYYEGVLVGQLADVAGAYEIATDEYIVGRDFRTGTTRFSGKLDDFAIWNRALDPTQILALAEGTSALDLPPSSVTVQRVVQTDIEAEMKGVSASAWLRVPFEVADPSELESLRLEMRYDDGYVAYLNGVEVARRNAPDRPAWDSAALGERGSTIELVSQRAEARWLVPDDGSLGTGWTGADFDDSAWDSGRPGFGFDTGPVDPEDSPQPFLYYPFETTGGDEVDDLLPADGPIDDLAPHPDGPFDGYGVGGLYVGDVPALLGHSSFSWEIDEESPEAEYFEISAPDVAMPDPLANITQGDFTIHNWFKTTDTERSIFMGACCDTPGELNFELHTGNRLRVWIRPPSGSTTDLNVSVSSIGDSRDGNWHSAACVRRGDRVELYYEGILVGESADVAGSFTQVPASYIVGRDLRFGATQYDGSLDDVAFWSEALTPEQIASLAQGADPLGLPGATSVGAQIGTSLEDAMRGRRSGLYLRMPFEVENPDDLVGLTLRVRYLDGFIAYINGQEVARANAPETAVWDSTAPAERPSSEAGYYEDVSLAGSIDLLRPGQNVLAIHAMSSSLDAETFLMRAVLLASTEGRDAQALLPERLDISSALDALRPGRNVLAIHGLNASADAPSFLILPELVTTVPAQEPSGLVAGETPGIAYGLSRGGKLWEIDWYRRTSVEIADLGAALEEGETHDDFASLARVPGSRLLYILRTDGDEFDPGFEDLIDTYDPAPGAASPYEQAVFETLGVDTASLSDGPAYDAFGEEPALYAIGRGGSFEVFPSSGAGTPAQLRTELPGVAEGPLVDLAGIADDDFQMYVLQDATLGADASDLIHVLTLDGDHEDTLAVAHEDAAAICSSPLPGFVYTQGRGGAGTHLRVFGNPPSARNVPGTVTADARATTALAPSPAEAFLFVVDDGGSDHLDLHDSQYRWRGGSYDNQLGLPASGSEPWADSSITDGSLADGTGQHLWLIQTTGKLYRIHPRTGSVQLMASLSPPGGTDAATYDSITDVPGDSRLLILRTDRAPTDKVGGAAVDAVDVYDMETLEYTRDAFRTVGTSAIAISDGPPYNAGGVATGDGPAVWVLGFDGSLEVLDPDGGGEATRVREAPASLAGVAVDLTGRDGDTTSLYVLRDISGDDATDRVDVYGVGGGVELDAYALLSSEATAITGTNPGDLFAVSADGHWSMVDVVAGDVVSVPTGSGSAQVTVTDLPGELGGPSGAAFRRGDADADGNLNITDAIFVLNFLFLGGPTPTCFDSADGDDSGTVNITDGIYILNFLFLGGNAPPSPHPGCGADPTDDSLECALYDGC